MNVSSRISHKLWRILLFLSFPFSRWNSAQSRSTYLRLQDANQMGRDTCQTTIIFLYLHPRLPSLSLRVYLGSGCSRISSVLPWPLAPSLYSAHSGCIPACCQPSRPVPVAGREREKEGRMERERGGEGKDGRRQRTSGEEKVSSSVWGKLLIRAEVIGNCTAEAVYPTVAAVMPSLGNKK